MPDSFLWPDSCLRRRLRFYIACRGDMQRVSRHDRQEICVPMDEPTPIAPARAREAPDTALDEAGARVIYRHKLATRIWHWVTVVTIVIMIGSGLTILNAHPHFYWGEYGANPDHP